MALFGDVSDEPHACRALKAALAVQVYELTRERTEYFGNASLVAV